MLATRPLATFQLAATPATTPAPRGMPAGVQVGRPVVASTGRAA